MSDKYYHLASEARAELVARQKNGVRDKVLCYWQKQNVAMPKLADAPLQAVLARQLSTARFEDILFREISAAAGFTPTWWAYPADKYTSFSALKRSFLHPRLCVGRDRIGLRIRKKRLANQQSWEKKPLSEISTFCGQTLVEWHRKHREIVLGPSLSLEVPLAGQSYTRFLSLFVADAVLFEDYHGGESGNVLDRFTAERFEPAWQQVYEELGFAPLIVRMPWWPELAYYPGSADWQSYGVVDPCSLPLR